MDDITFEDALEKIRAIVTEMEQGELSLEASIDKFAEATLLLDAARQLIADAELRVSVLAGDDAEDA